MKWSHLARRDQPTKGGVYVIIVSAPGQDPLVLQETPGPSFPQPPAKRPWGGARLLLHSSLPWRRAGEPLEPPQVLGWG